MSPRNAHTQSTAQTVGADLAAGLNGFIIVGRDGSDGPVDGQVVPFLGGFECSNHLTPEELSKEMGIERQEVIRLCLEEGVPIYHGKIDKTLFQAQLEASRAMPQNH